MEIIYYNDVILEILLNLLKIDVYSILNARLVCKNWYFLIKKHKNIFLKNPVIFGASLHNLDVVNLFNIDILLEFLNKQNDIYNLFNENFTFKYILVEQFIHSNNKSILKSKNIIVKILKNFIELSDNEKNSNKSTYDYKYYTDLYESVYKIKYTDSETEKDNNKKNGYSFEYLTIVINEIINSYLKSCTPFTKKILGKHYGGEINVNDNFFRDTFNNFIELMFVIQTNNYPIDKTCLNKIYVPKNNPTYFNKFKQIKKINKSWPNYFIPNNPNTYTPGIYGNDFQIQNNKDIEYLWENTRHVSYDDIYDDTIKAKDYTLNNIHLNLTKKNI